MKVIYAITSGVFVWLAGYFCFIYFVWLHRAAAVAKANRLPTARSQGSNPHLCHNPSRCSQILNPLSTVSQRECLLLDFLIGISIIYQIIPLIGGVPIHFFLHQNLPLCLWLSIIIKDRCINHWFSLSLFFSVKCRHSKESNTHVCKL